MKIKLLNVGVVFTKEIIWEFVQYFLVEELKEYIGMLYGLMEKDRLFQTTTKAYWEHEIQRGIEVSGVKRIRLHDLRHSHASLLISKLGA